MAPPTIRTPSRSLFDPQHHFAARIADYTASPFLDFSCIHTSPQKCQKIVDPMGRDRHKQVFGSNPQPARKSPMNVAGET